MIRTVITAGVFDVIVPQFYKDAMPPLSSVASTFFFFVLIPTFPSSQSFTNLASLTQLLEREFACVSLCMHLSLESASVLSCFC